MSTEPPPPHDISPAAPRIPRLTQGRLLPAAPYLSLLLLLPLWAGAAWFSWVFPDHLLKETRKELGNSVMAAAIQTDSALREAQRSLLGLDLWLNTRQGNVPLDDAALARFVENAQDSSRGLVTLLLSDRQGLLYRLPAVARHPVGRLDAAALAEFDAAAAGGPQRVGTPLRLREGGPLYLPMALPTSHALGEPGLLLALLDLRRLSERLAPYATGDGALALIREDGLALLREPELPGFVGRRLFDEFPERGAALAPPSGEFTTLPSTSDGVPRLSRFETLDEFGIKVTVGRSVERALVEHHQQRRWVLAISTLISLSTLGAAVALGRLLRREREHDALEQASADASPLGLIRIDTQGRLVQANSTYHRLLGQRPDQLATGWLQCIADDDERERTRRQWLDAISQGQPVDVVQPLRAPDGRLRLFRVRTRPLRVDGRLIGAAGTVDDVTERRLAQRAQRALNDILAKLPDPVCQFDADGQLRYLNPAARARLHLGEDTPLDGLNYRMVHDAQGQRHYQDEVLPAALAQGFWQGRSLLRTPDGDMVPTDATLLVHRNARDEVEMLSAILRDVSAELRAEQERERSAAMLQAVAEVAPSKILVLDRELRVLFFNQTFEQRFRVQRESWLGRPVRELLGERDYELSRDLFEAALAGRSGEQERRYERANQALVMQVQYAPLRRSSGEIDGVICTGRDISDLAAMRSEAQRLLDVAQSDALTQLLNRAGFEAHAGARLEQARLDGALVGLLYLDLDRFKPVNDRYGHPVGDALLRAVAGRIRHALRKQDLVARLGGDEFCVLLPALHSAEEAERIGAKLVSVVSSPFQVEQLQIEVGVSVGYCVAAGERAELEAMVALADSQLYAAKRAGRGCVRGQVMP